MALFLLFAPQDMLAQDSHTLGPILQIKAQPVVDTAETPEKAKEKALLAGQLSAFMQLVSMLVTEEDFESIPILTKAQLDPVTATMAVEKENISEMLKSQSGGEPKKIFTYRARVAYNFRKDEIEKLLDVYDIVLKEYHQPPILVLPLFNYEGEMILWEGDNPWEDAWNNIALSDKKSFVMVPLGDIEDVRNIKVDDVLARDFTVFKSLAARYGAEHILIAEAELNGETLTVKLEPMGESKIPPEQMVFTMGKDTEISGFLTEVVSELMERINSFREAMRTAAEHHEAVDIIVPTSDARHIIHLKKRMEALKLVLKVEMKEISLERSVLRLEYKDDLATFMAYLDTSGFPATRLGDNYVLTLDDTNQDNSIKGEKR